jgi:mercuric ion transport protein
MLRSSQPASLGSLLAAFIAVAASSCCALPLGLAVAGVSTGAIGLLEPLHAYRPMFVALASLLLGWGWATVLFRRHAVRSVPVIMLGLASTLLLVAFTWELWDPWAMHMLSRLR